MYRINREADFDIGQLVYVKTDPEQSPNIVIAYRVTEKEVFYECARGMMVNVHSGLELASEKNVGQYG